MKAPLVIIVDDNEPFRLSTEFLVEGFGYRTRAFEEPALAVDAIAAVPLGEPCCVLLDVRMPSMSGLAAHEALRERASNMPVIYMTGHGDVPLAVEAMRKGALTFLEKPLDDLLLESALEQAFRPVVQCRRRSPRAQERLLGVSSALDTLSGREREVLAMVTDELTNREIAERLGLAAKTVEHHRHRIITKLGVKNTAELLRLLFSGELA